MKILVIGLRPQHCKLLVERFPEHKFSFKDSNQRVRGKQKSGGDYDLIYSNYAFTNHSVERAWGGNPNYIRVRSYTHVVQLLTSFREDE